MSRLASIRPAKFSTVSPQEVRVLSFPRFFAQAFSKESGELRNPILDFAMEDWIVAKILRDSLIDSRAGVANGIECRGLLNLGGLGGTGGEI